MDDRSERNLRGVDPRLVRITRAAHEAMEQDSNGLSFVVTEGVRTTRRQAELVKAGASRTMDSYHIRGEAIDFAATVNGEVRFDWPLYPRIARRFKEAAADLGYVITWGGDWRTFKDGPHVQIEEGLRA